MPICLIKVLILCRFGLCISCCEVSCNGVSVLLSDCMIFVMSLLFLFCRHLVTVQFFFYSKHPVVIIYKVQRSKPSVTTKLLSVSEI